MDKFDLTNPDHAYFYGLFMADGSTSVAKGTNKTRMSIELKTEDEEILLKVRDILPIDTILKRRVRDTNFKKGYGSTILFLRSGYEVYKELSCFGLPSGKKTGNETVPTCEYDEVGFWRGMLDGDGSFGITKNGLPFVSLTTMSYALADAYRDFLEKHLGKRKLCSSNKRGQFEIMITKEDAQKLVYLLYSPGCLCMERKRLKALEILDWERPEDMAKVTWSREQWNAEEEQMLCEHTLEDCLVFLGRCRTESAIKIAYYRYHKPSVKVAVA